MYNGINEGTLTGHRCRPVTLPGSEQNAKEKRLGPCLQGICSLVGVEKFTERQKFSDYSAL